MSVPPPRCASMQGSLRLSVTSKRSVLNVRGEGPHTTKQIRQGVTSRCACARVHSRVFSLPDTASAAPSATRRCHTASSGMESGIGDCPRDQPVGGSHHAPGDHARLGLRSKPDRIADRCTCDDAAPLASVYSVHRVGRTSLSHSPPSAEPTADRASEPSSLAAGSRNLAVGMACIDSLGPRSCDRAATACHVYPTRPGAADASEPNAASFAPCAALIGIAR